VADRDIRHIGRHRQQIICECSAAELAVLGISALLVQCFTNTLNDAAANLLVDQQWIDNPATVFDHPVS